MNLARETSDSLRWPRSWLVGMTISLMAASPAVSHPHAWIDLVTRIHVNANAEITKIEQVWQIDPSYSIVLLEEELASGGERPLDVALADMATDLHDRLIEADYLMRMEQRLNTVSDDDSAQQSRQNASAEPSSDVQSTPINMAQNGAFAEPLIEWQAPHLLIRTTWAADTPIAADRLLIRSFDPVYWMEMLHVEKPTLIDESTRCSVALVPPRPNLDLIRFAATLDRDERDPVLAGGDPLGLFFAERVELNCAPEQHASRIQSP
ncbi:MAG: DUF1007 family protein [Thioalkalivibrionaceae bacterium]